jgi:hypothetical protein
VFFNENKSAGRPTQVGELQSGVHRFITAQIRIHRVAAHSLKIGAGFHTGIIQAAAIRGD